MAHYCDPDDYSDPAVVDAAYKNIVARFDGLKSNALAHL